MNLLVLVLLLLFFVSFSASGKQLSRSLHPANDVPPSALSGLARISHAEAEKIALALETGRPLTACASPGRLPNQGQI